MRILLGLTIGILAILSFIIGWGVVGDVAEASRDENGCTPGFWKNHVKLWQGFPGNPELALFSDTFNVDAFPDLTLLDVLAQGGGGLNALGRHTVAAILNAKSPFVDYLFSESLIIENFFATFQDNEATEEQKELFEAANELGECPLPLQESDN